MLRRTIIDKKTISIKVSKEVYDFLKKYAKSKNMNTSKLVQMILSEWIVKKVKWKIWNLP